MYSDRPKTSISIKFCYIRITHRAALRNDLDAMAEDSKRASPSWYVNLQIQMTDKSSRTPSKHWAKLVLGQRPPFCEGSYESLQRLERKNRKVPFLSARERQPRASSDRFLSLSLSTLKPNIFLYPKLTYQVQDSSNNSIILIQILEKVHKNSVII